MVKVLLFISILTNIFANGEFDSVFKHIVVRGEDGVYEVTGEASTRTGTFYYTVEDGHYQYVDETEITLAKKFPTWEKFNIKIQIPKKKLPSNATLILNLYERNENNQITHTHPVVLQRFK